MLPTFPDNKNRLFWALQIAGWFGYAVLNYLIGIEINEQPADYFVPSFVYALGGIATTCALRPLFRLIWDWHPLKIILIGGAGAILAAIVLTGCRSLVHVWFYGALHWANLSFTDYFNLWDLTFSLYVIGTWSGLYFGIRYYQTVQQQKERLLRATATAHEAQLKMLRYQLNPHFLFNTLNAISTLVLEGENEAANRMLTRLGVFLRRSLHGDPVQKTTLNKEIEALRLYLSIEQVRFEDFLEVEYDIDPSTQRALVPSLILQPLIENAIKHAIALNEGGGKISIAGWIQDGKLYLQVTDSGPGSGNPTSVAPVEPSGIGLKNIRERLSVLYGEAQHLSMERIEPDSLAVTITIPFEHEQSENPQRPDRR